MSWTYDWTNSPTIARVRMMVGDTDPTTPIFQDDEVQGALNANCSQNIIVGLSGFNVGVPQIYSFGRAAALLLNSLNATRARGLVVKVLDVQLDQRSASQSLKDLAQQYIDQDATAGYFAVAEMGDNQFWMRERLQKMLYRTQT